MSTRKRAPGKHADRVRRVSSPPDVPVVYVLHERGCSAPLLPCRCRSEIHVRLVPAAEYGEHERIHNARVARIRGALW